MALVSWMVHRPFLMLLVFLLIMGVTGFGFLRHPTGFLPTEDQGFAAIVSILPEGASQPRAQAAYRKVNEILKNTKGLLAWVTIGNFSFLDFANVSNINSTFIVYDSWANRGAALSQDNILAALRPKLGAIQDALTFVAVPPPIRGLGQSKGFQMMIEDRQGLGYRRTVQGHPGDHCRGQRRARFAQPGLHLQLSQPPALSGHRPDQGRIAPGPLEQCL